MKDYQRISLFVLSLIKITNNNLTYNVALTAETLIDINHGNGFLKNQVTQVILSLFIRLKFFNLFIPTIIKKLKNKSLVQVSNIENIFLKVPALVL